MLNPTDEMIEELCKQHDSGKLTPGEIREIRQKIAAVLIDDVLDNRRKQILAQRAKPKTAPITSGARDLGN